jgi:hypothetical protein
LSNANVIKTVSVSRLSLLSHHDFNVSNLCFKAMITALSMSDKLRREERFGYPERALAVRSLVTSFEATKDLLNV